MDFFPPSFSSSAADSLGGGGSLKLIGEMGRPRNSATVVRIASATRCHLQDFLQLSHCTRLPVNTHTHTRTRAQVYAVNSHSLPCISSFPQIRQNTGWHVLPHSMKFKVLSLSLRQKNKLSIRQSFPSDNIALD